MVRGIQHYNNNNITTREPTDFHFNAVTLEFTTANYLNRVTLSQVNYFILAVFRNMFVLG